MQLPDYKTNANGNNNAFVKEMIKQELKVQHK